jgi:Zn-dependent oligopeptidase
MARTLSQRFALLTELSERLVNISSVSNRVGPMDRLLAQPLTHGRSLKTGQARPMPFIAGRKGPAAVVVGVEESDAAVTIILKTKSPTGWKSASAVLDDGHAVLCPACGAICHETAVDVHDAWHADLAHKTLPLLADFLTEIAEIAEIAETAETEETAETAETAETEETARGPEVSAKAHIQLPKLTAADVEG